MQEEWTGKGAFCKYCWKDDLLWHQKKNGKWVLVEVHTCDKRQGTQDQRPARRA